MEGARGTHEDVSMLTTSPIKSRARSSVAMHASVLMPVPISYADLAPNSFFSSATQRMSVSVCAAARARVVRRGEEGGEA